ncbi:NUDIX hydrolase [Williamsia muralis]|uniref:NUDIX hydrolase n=1 Tax=Williamsia marianensis TaxID=85044 RepID=A0ABU4EQJ5_WILMA|nr:MULTISPECIES: NUDIX hydrolase [Williamsia]MDV7133505.1 NUDIX hydrolase [Williamsia muralis]
MSAEPTEPNRDVPRRPRRRRGNRRGGSTATRIDSSHHSGAEPRPQPSPQPGPEPQRSDDSTVTDATASATGSRRSRRGRRRKPSRPADHSVEAARSESTGVAGTHVVEGRTAQVKPSDVGKVKAPAKVPPNLAKQRLRTVRETSAGGLMVSGLDGPHEQRCAALIGRVDRRGRMMWSLPKGHIETGETAEQTAIREVAEETGIEGNVVAPLGKIDYWFVSEGKRIHKTVHHYLMRFTGGELSDADYEVAEVAWVPLAELPRRLTYSDERRLARVAEDVIAELVADPDRMAESEAKGARTEPNAYEKAAAARNQKRNEPPPAPARPRRRRRRGRRGGGGGTETTSENRGAGNSGGPAAHAPPPESGPHVAT